MEIVEVYRDGKEWAFDVVRGNERVCVAFKHREFSMSDALRIVREEFPKFNTLESAMEAFF